MRAWTGVNLIKPQTLVKEGAKWWPPPPAAVCTGLAVCLPSEDSRTHTCTRQGVRVGGCCLWNWSRCWPDIIYRWTHAQTRLAAACCWITTHNHQNGSFQKSGWITSDFLKELNACSIRFSADRQTSSPQQPLKPWFSPLGVMSKHGTFKRPLFVVRPLIIYCKHCQSCMFLLRRANRCLQNSQNINMSLQLTNHGVKVNIFGIYKALKIY